jgi:thiamine biosynthesis lipoprotein
MEAEARFRAMGSDVHVIVVGGRLDQQDAARDLLEDLEARWSRFRPTSEVSRMNLLAGLPVRVAPVTLDLVQRALEGARITGGRFDPTVLGAVLRAGYDRSFELLGEDEPRSRSTLRLGGDGIAVDNASSTVTIPPGVGFDPGGIGKGLAADVVVRELLSRGAAGVCVNVGGDLRVEGDPAHGEAWTVAIEHPIRADVTQLVGLRSGAVATSSRMRRTWGPPSDRRHHLIDPATGAPARTGLASASVIAAEGWQAEVVAKAAFVAGVAEGLFVLASTGAEGVLVDDDGRAYPSAGFHRFGGGGVQAFPIRVEGAS